MTVRQKVSPTSSYEEVLITTSQDQRSKETVVNYYNQKEEIEN